MQKIVEKKHLQRGFPINLQYNLIDLHKSNNFTAITKRNNFYNIRNGRTALAKKNLFTQLPFYLSGAACHAES
jgi:hypothetical protein